MFLFHQIIFENPCNYLQLSIKKYKFNWDDQIRSGSKTCMPTEPIKTDISFMKRSRIALVSMEKSLRQAWMAL